MLRGSDHTFFLLSPHSSTGVKTAYIIERFFDASSFEIFVESSNKQVLEPHKRVYVDVLDVDELRVYVAVATKVILEELVCHLRGLEEVEVLMLVQFHKF